MEFSDKHIIHMDQDAFFVSVEILKNSKLLGLPVIIGGLSDRGVVASCSYEARAYGVHSAMPSRMARQLCPHAIFVKGSMDDYSKYSHQVTELLQEKVPLLEKASIDEHYIDMTGMDRFFGCMKFAQELRHAVLDQIGLPISFGLSVNKTVSKMATNECKPNGEKQVEKLAVQSFLNPLSIKKIPGLGDSTFIKLSEMGVRKIHTLTQIPQDLMFKILGQNGLSLWQKANGIDNSPVVPYREQKSIGKQTTFESDSMDIAGMKIILTDMITKLAFELRQKQKLTACITVTIRYANFETITQQAKIPYTSLDSVLISKAKELFDKVYQKRMLLRLVGVKLSHLVSGYEQIALYGPSEKMYNLYQSMDKMRSRYGVDTIKLATVLPNKGETKKLYRQQ
ncbi:DNA polymerase IV [Pedobacter sp. LMG 31464]|uniref:DNA polymerase IV n=1 Tax=Pedobacter planticolens TaxID=2679964 RepID=A0A923IW53_9SPHI|nr:DNA polymerase IV [Pedobacter planticolens]MBB2144807.1 DNA polymerase IV [Pedobacter planticolens]